MVTREEWLAEGAVEHPTHMETLLKPEQQARIRWLKKPNLGKILDMGCNWGYISNEIGASCGVDINLENIDLAMRKFPHIHFMTGDITAEWQFDNNQYDTVVMADVLEHVDYELLNGVLSEALRVAKKRVLITLPIKDDEACAQCFKHSWIPDTIFLGGIVMFFAHDMKLKTTVETDEYFAYIEVAK